MVDVARDLRVDFLKLAPSRDFETSFARGHKTVGSHLNLVVDKKKKKKKNSQFPCKLTHTNNLLFSP